jgi:acetylglutamate kinase
MISGSLNAEKLLIMTDIDGVYLDIKDPSTLLKSITINEIKLYTEQGIITGGMLPKLDCCMMALKSGTKEHNLLSALLQDNGTKIIYESEE